MSRKFLHFIFFVISFIGVTLTFYLCYNKIYFYTTSNYNLNTTNIQNTLPTNIVSFKVALISDSHLNDEIFPLLKKSLDLYQPNLVIHAGDLTNFGSIAELANAKNELDSLNYSYIAIPGDHDVAQSSSEDNFDKFFTYPEFKQTPYFKILFIPNYFNFTPFEKNKFNSILSQIESSDLIISSQPIYVDPNNIFADKYMGSFTAFENLNPTQKSNLNIYLDQRNQILKLIRKTTNPKLVISGDHHRTSNFSDPENSLVTYHILGSLSKYIYMGGTQLLQTSLQSNRYTQLNIIEATNKEFSYELREIELYNFKK